MISGVDITPYDLAKKSPTDRDIASPDDIAYFDQTLMGPIACPN